MKNPFEDFPKYSDWWLGEKAIRWRKKHEVEILRQLGLLESIKDFITGRKGDIEMDIEDFGQLKDVLSYFLEEGEKVNG